MIKISIDKLHKAEWNYKTDNKDLKQKLVENIKKNGQIENLIVRITGKDKYEVVNGNHRYDALQEIGLKEVWCFNLGKISESQAKRIAIETNETRFESDNIKLAKLMKEISEEFKVEDLVITMPFNEEEINNFTKLLDSDWNQFDKKEVEFETSGLEKIILQCEKKELKKLIDDIEKIIKKYKTVKIIK